MNEQRLNRFKKLLSVPSKSRNESQMVNFICTQLDNMIDSGVNLDYYLDELSNIYVTKGESESYPCFISHTDTVHEIDSINVVEGIKTKPNTFGKSFGDEEFDVLYAVNDQGNPTGIGGDDKSGIFICLEILRNVQECKLAFFVSEEIGCIGSSNADVEFFNDVTFVCEYDAPGDHLITEICSGVRLYEVNGEFINTMKPIIENSFGNPMIEQSHPFTDVMQLKNKLPVSCINISCGYYNMHSVNEFIALVDVEKAIDCGISMTMYGLQDKYYYENDTPKYFNDSKEDVYESENSKWLSEGVVIFDEDSSGITIEEYETGNCVYLTEKECKKLYETLKSKFAPSSQYRLF